MTYERREEYLNRCQSRHPTAHGLLTPGAGDDLDRGRYSILPEWRRVISDWLKAAGDSAAAIR